MDIEEVCGVVWRALAQTDHSMSAQDLASAESLPAGDIRRALATLSQSGLLQRDQSVTPPVYRLQRELNALQWAQAVEAGVELPDLEAHARLKSGQREQDVLKAAARGDVEKDRERQAVRRHTIQQERLAGRRASQAAQTDLARLVADVKAAFAILPPAPAGQTAAEDEAVRKALEDAQAEAERALQALQASLR
jgi:hypothetical protein